MDLKLNVSNAIECFHNGNFRSICDGLARKDPAFATIVKAYGYPPMWTRPPGFATLVHIILEQQVSLASAKAAFNKLQERITTINPQNLIKLTDAALRECYFSRQKTVYVRDLAMAILSGRLNLDELSNESATVIREKLKAVKGIGDWTADIYLIFALQRTDIFPTGDLAMVNAMKEIKQLNKDVTKDILIEMSGTWSPYRSVATMLLWHYYICKRGIKI